MKTKRILLYILIFPILLACVPDGDNQGTLNDSFSDDEVVNLRIIVRNAMTGESSKTWLIHAVTFKSSTGNMDASNLKNIKDDEFIFRKIDDSEENQFRGIVEWRPGLSIPEDAVTIEDLGAGTYTDPMTIEFEVGPPSEGKRTVPNQFRITFDESTLTNLSGKRISSDKKAPKWRWKYWYGNVDTIDEKIERSFGIWFFPPDDCLELQTNGVKYALMSLEAKQDALSLLCAREKVSEDYINDLAANLVFEEEFSFFSKRRNWTVDMGGSNKTNSLYIATAETSIPERIIKYDISSGQIEESLNFESAKSDKNILISDDYLWVLGPQFINRYDLYLTNPPQVFNVLGENRRLFRTKAAINNDFIYLFGISEWVEQSQGWYASGEGYLQIVYKWEIGTDNEITENHEGEYPYIDPIIVDDKMYYNVLTRFYNLNTNAVESLANPVSSQTPQTQGSSYHIYNTTSLKNRIYLTGKESGTLRPFIAVYNTENGASSELSTNLNRPNKETIEGMTIVNGRIYILYGQYVYNESVLWQVLSAPLE